MDPLRNPTNPPSEPGPPQALHDTRTAHRTRADTDATCGRVPMHGQRSPAGAAVQRCSAEPSAGFIKSRKGGGTLSNKPRLLMTLSNATEPQPHATAGNRNRTQVDLQAKRSRKPHTAPKPHETASAGIRRRSGGHAYQAAQAHLRMRLCRLGPTRTRNPHPHPTGTRAQPTPAPNPHSRPTRTRAQAHA